jgi:hypothetical protein
MQLHRKLKELSLKYISNYGWYTEWVKLHMVEHQLKSLRAPGLMGPVALHPSYYFCAEAQTFEIHFATLFT